MEVLLGDNMVEYVVTADAVVNVVVAVLLTVNAVVSPSPHSPSRH